jgi:hypothetical protein
MEILLEMLIISQLVKKFPACYGNRCFITEHLPPDPNPSQPNPAIHNFLKSVV